MPKTILNKFQFAFHFILCSFFLFITLDGCATAPSGPSTSGGYVWPSPPATPKIKWVRNWSNKNDFAKPNQVLEFLIGKERVERLQRPNGVVSDSAGNVYVADSEFRMVFVFDQEQKTLRYIGMGTLSGPVGLAIDNKRGILYVSDARTKNVYGLDKHDGRIVMTVGAPTEIQGPSGMAFDEERNRLYVVDTRAHTIRVFDKDGKSLFTIGKRGSGDGEFNFPSYVAVDKNGKIYVTDSFNFRIQVFDADGKFVKKFGRAGDVSGSFSRPGGIGVDSEGHIYVTDAAFNNFQIFDQDGRLLLWIGNAGGEPGQFYLPSALYIDKDNRIYVTDTFNRRVQVFQYLTEKK